MPLSKNLKAFLDEKQIRYLTLHHSPAYTSQELAAATHISGRAWAKTVGNALGPQAEVQHGPRPWWWRPTAS